MSYAARRRFCLAHQLIPALADSVLRTLFLRTRLPIPFRAEPVTPSSATCVSPEPVNQISFQPNPSTGHRAVSTAPAGPADLQ
jgi:hypothetical protein